MAQPLAALFATRSRWFDLGVFLTGLLLVGWATLTVVRDGISMSGVALISIPLIVVIAKFPMILDSGDGGIEVGFDSSILMYLLCTTDQAEEALVIWSLGVLVTQITTDKRPMVKLFNVGVGIVGGAVSAAVLQGIRGDAIGTPRELVAVAFAAAAYFATDFLLSAISVAIESETPLRSHLVQGGTLIAVACFVPFDSLGYLGAVVSRELPWWTLLLLAVPLATLLVATRAVTRGGENARRLSVLFDAAVRAQTLSDTRQVVDALIDDARPAAADQAGRGPRDARRAPTRSAPSCATASVTGGSSRRDSTGRGRRPLRTSRPSRRWSRSPPTPSRGCGSPRT